MKQVIIFFSVFILFSGISSCGKLQPDKSKPVIILNDASTIEIPQGIDTPDPGAMATDDKDGDISSKITSDWSTRLNTEKIGSYLVTYTIKDYAGNEAKATRTVLVKYFAVSVSGEYISSYTNKDNGTVSAPFNATVSVGEIASQMVIYPLGDNQVYMKADMGAAFGNSLTFAQTEPGITYSGTGEFENSGKTIKLSFKAVTGGSTSIMTQTLTRK